MAIPSVHPSRNLFEPILDEHEELEELFLAHQVALMALDMERAVLTLDSFTALLERHMLFEEEQLMPAWMAQGGAQERLGPELLAHEHEKLVRRLAALRQALLAFASRTNVSHAEIIDLFDEELRFKRLLHHHDERERLGLYPFLERELNAQRLETLRARVAEYCA